MTALREVASIFGVRFDDSELRKGIQSVGAGITVLSRFGSMVAGSQLVRGIADFAAETVEAFREIRASATTLRVSTDELQSARAGLAVAGLTAQEAAGTFAVFHRNVRAAATGGGDAGAAFWRLGIRLRDSQRVVRSSSDLLDEVAARFERIQHPERRARLAVQLFGDAGLRLLPVLHRGAGGIAEMRAELGLLGGGVTPAAIESARRYELALTRWRLVGDATRSQLAVGLLPVLTRLVDGARGASLVFTRLMAHTHGVRNALAILGTAGALAGAHMLAPWLPAILLFAGVAAMALLAYLVLDSLVTLAEGGRSVVGEFLDAWFGPGTAQKIATSLRMITELREAYEGLKLALSDLGGFFTGLVGGGTPEDHSGQSAADMALTRRIAVERARRTAAAAEGNADLQANLAGLSPRARRVLGGATTVMGEITPGPARATAAAPAPRGTTTTTVQHHRTLAPVFQIHGGGNEQRVVELAMREMRTLLENERDAAHPQQPQDD
jgi:hypothetical protein